MTRGKKSILVVALVLALCAAMLFGATVAYFTSTKSISNNTIKVADYNVDLKYATTTTWPTNDNGWGDLSDVNQLFVDSDALKPGEKTDVKYIKIINNNEYAINATVDISAIAQAIGETTQTNLTNDDKLNLYAKTTGVSGEATFSDSDLRSAGEGGKYTLNIGTIAAKSDDTPGEAVIAIQFELPEAAVTPSVSNTFTIEVKTEQVHTTTT